MDSIRRAVITDIDGRTVFAYMIGESIYDLVVGGDEKVRVGDVYVGKVKNVVDNIKAAFVEFADGEKGFLPLRKEQLKNIKPEQEIVVQVKKPAKGIKDATLGTTIELVGRYLIFQYEVGVGDGLHINYSKRLSEVDRESISLGDAANDKESSSNLSTELSVMVRTNAANATAAELESEWGRFRDIFINMAKHCDMRTANSCLYREPPFYIRKINSYPSDDIQEVVTDREEIYEALSGLESVRLYDDESYPIDARYGIKTTIEKALERRVWLKSGANLIIDRTEAMTVIDVNTAKAIDGKRASETTFFKVNIEAAAEVARQLRLRSLSGIILVDFIDMKDREHIDSLIAFLREKLAADPVHAMYIDYTKLGLVEITRAREHASIYETFGTHDH